MLDVSMDAGRLPIQLGALARLMGLTVRDVAYDQMRLWVQDLIRRTPPKSKGQGQKAINRDLNKLFAPANPGFVNFLEEDYHGEGRLPSSVKMNLEGNQSRMRGFHQRNRNQSGRVRYKAGVVATHGNIQFQNKMYVPAKTFRDYLKSVQKGVGKLKAGWIRSGLYYAQKAHGPMKIPSWVSAQAQKLGDKTDAMKPSGNGFIEARNYAPGAGNNKSLKRWVALTWRTRQRDIEKHADKRVDKIINQFNKAA